MIATASVTSCALLFGDPNPLLAEVGVPFPGPGYSSSAEGSVRLKPCDAKSNCVSSNYLEPPNRYMSPLKIVNDRDVAFQRAVRELQKQGNSNPNSALNGFTVQEIISKEYYIHLTTPGKVPGSIYDVELVFPQDSGIVNVRCEARVALPPPPFCVKKNCINGNMDQRQAVEDLMFGVLGLPPADQKQMQEGAKWTPIFFNSDRVPGFDDYYD